MFLSDLIILNYKSCRKLHVKFEADSPNVLIGINDCGKTTILQAIGLLLSSKPNFNYLTDAHQKTDISNTRISDRERAEILGEAGLPDLPVETDDCTIVGGFRLEGGDLSAENAASLSNHLLWTVENAEDGLLWLARSFSSESQKAVDLLLTPDAVDAPQNIFKATQAQITRARHDYGVTDQDIENENQRGRFSNLEIMRAIYRKISLAPHWVEYKVDKDVWTQYRYLDWTLSLDQLKEIVNEILKSRITAQLNQLNEFARRQKDESQAIVNAELEAFTAILAQDVRSIQRVKANIVLTVDPKVTDILLNKTNTDGDIHLDSQGEGIKRQLWFALLKWKTIGEPANQETGKKYIWCFDEPETHLYPQAQRDFFEIIKKVSRSNVQTVLSTHSTIFIDHACFNFLKKVDLVNGYTEVAGCQTTEDIYHSLRLRNSDFLFHDYFLAVEGDTECVLIPHLYRLFFGKSLQDDNIQLISLGGREKLTENRRILERLLVGFRKDIQRSVIFLLDRDAVFFLTPQEERELGWQLYLVGYQDIEDCLPSELWRKLVLDVYGGQLDLGIETIDRIKAQICKADRNRPETKLEKNQKFYPLLCRHVRQTAQSRGLAVDLLPAKGSESGQLISKLMVDREDIPPSIGNAFAHLNTLLQDEETRLVPMRFAEALVKS